MNLTVALVAGGRGSRLASAMGERPKCLAEVADRPFLAHLIALYRRQGFRSVHLCLGVGAQQVVDEVVSKDPSVTYTIEERPLGTAGSLRHALPHLAENVVVALGDSYTPEPVRPFLDDWVTTKVPAAMVVLENHDAMVPSNVELEGRWVSRYRKHERPRGWTFVDYGIYLMRREVIESMPPGYADLDSVFGPMVEARRLRAYTAVEPFWEIGTPAALERVRLAVAEGRLRL